MAASGWGVDDFEDKLSEMFQHLDDTLSQVRDRVWAKAADAPPAAESARTRDRHREDFRQARRGHGFPFGGFPGPWNGWWPGPSGPPPGAAAPQTSLADVRAAILALLQEGP
ncbi:MAG TPA: hypothetical protein VKV33_00705, partial [Streptosporangiaceae bacterium]|nr:hypothetical protein [Streptosporangiaceae bacterium]